MELLKSFLARISSSNAIKVVAQFVYSNDLGAFLRKVSSAFQT